MLFVFIHLIIGTISTEINLDFLKQKGTQKKQDALFDELLKVANMINENMPKGASKSQNALWNFLDGYRAITKGQVFPKEKRQMKEILALGKQLLNE